jgi:hypothetical protein
VPAQKRADKVISRDHILDLCRRGEGTKLDFKEFQYKLRSNQFEATQGTEFKSREKSKALKDILAMANSTGEAPAHIIIGVSKDESTGIHVPSGLDHSLDDADFQNLLGPKVVPSPSFRYDEILVDTNVVGVLTVFSSARKPHFSEEDFGLVRGKVFYIRQGSSNREASIEQVEDLYRERLRADEYELMKTYITLLTKAEAHKLRPQLAILCNVQSSGQDHVVANFTATNNGELPVQILRIWCTWNARFADDVFGDHDFGISRRLTKGEFLVRDLPLNIDRVRDRKKQLFDKPLSYGDTDVKVHVKYAGVDDVEQTEVFQIV